MKYYLVLFLPIFTTFHLTAQVAMQRPQEPIKPYSYLSEDITFRNKQADISLAGTLTLPKNQSDFPVVILISGSSPHNRNQEIAGHKPFLVIADYLTTNGIGVLRYDDRGVGQSQGKYEIAAYQDRASDVASAIAYLKTRKEIDKKKIGLIGHSEGGLIAPIVASKSKDVSFIILLAASGVPGYDIILLQTELGNQAKGISDTTTQTELTFLKSIFDPVVTSTNLDSTKSNLSNYFRTRPALLPGEVRVEDVDLLLETFTAPWFQKILTYNPGSSLELVNCHVLALNGSKDLQIPPEENLMAIQNALEKGGNRKVTIRELPQLNHLFQEAQTGLPEEFETIDQTFSPIALREITDWILTHTKRQ